MGNGNSRRSGRGTKTMDIRWILAPRLPSSPSPPSMSTSVLRARWVTRPSVGWFAEVTFLGRASWGLSSLRPSVAVEQGASLESVMVERENVVMEGENRSHGGGSDDDQTLGSHSQRHPRVRTLQQQKHVDLIFTSLLGTWHAAPCRRI